MFYAVHLHIVNYVVPHYLQGVSMHTCKTHIVGRQKRKTHIIAGVLTILGCISGVYGSSSSGGGDAQLGVRSGDPQGSTSKAPGGGSAAGARGTETSSSVVEREVLVTYKTEDNISRENMEVLKKAIAKELEGKANGTLRVINFTTPIKNGDLTEAIIQILYPKEKPANMKLEILGVVNYQADYTLYCKLSNTDNTPLTPPNIIAAKDHSLAIQLEIIYETSVTISANMTLESLTSKIIEKLYPDGKPEHVSLEITGVGDIPAEGIDELYYIPSQYLLDNKKIIYCNIFTRDVLDKIKEKQEPPKMPLERYLENWITNTGKALLPINYRLVSKKSVDQLHKGDPYIDDADIGTDITPYTLSALNRAYKITGYWTYGQIQTMIRNENLARIILPGGQEIPYWFDEEKQDTTLNSLYTGDENELQVTIIPKMDDQSYQECKKAMQSIMKYTVNKDVNTQGFRWKTHIIRYNLPSSSGSVFGPSLSLLIDHNRRLLGKYTSSSEYQFLELTDEQYREQDADIPIRIYGLTNKPTPNNSTICPAYIIMPLKKRELVMLVVLANEDGVLRNPTSTMDLR